MDEAEYTCPKCGGSAELSQGYETNVVCPKCGETAITMRFLTNGDIETVKGNESLEEVFLELVDDIKVDEDQAQEGGKNA